MSKMIKLYRLDVEKAKTMNIGHFNPTCKAILKAMYRIEKEHADEDQFPGSTGDAILQYAVKHSLWATRQAPEKYHTTWAYYVKKLKEQAHVFESGTVAGSGEEEYLDADGFLEDVMEDDVEEVEFAEAAE